MCYAKSLTLSDYYIEKQFRNSVTFATWLEYEPSFHRSAFTKENIYIIPQDDNTSIYPAAWGLIPGYAQEDPESFRKKYNTANARMENVFDSPIYRNSIRSKRCLILADGFYEPHTIGKESQPYYFHLENRKLFCFAGVYKELGADFYTAALITVPANELFAKVHNKKPAGSGTHRMPLVLNEDFYWEWLNPATPEDKIKELLKVGFTRDDFTTYPVNSIINKDRSYNKPDILEPVPPKDMFLDV